MNTYQDVIDMFLNLISEVKYLEYDLDELKVELGIKSKMVLAEARVIKKVKFDSKEQEFTRELTDMEALILAHGLVVNWVSPKIYNYELMETQIASKDFTIFSNSGLLGELRALLEKSEAKFHGLILDYDYDITYLATEEDDE